MQAHTPQKRYFENLDGLRFMLAMIVFFAHAQFGVGLKSICPNDTLQRLISVFTNGYYGVSFFFVLSGFLITYLMLEEQETTANFSVRNFYIRRILRIWPVYYAVLLFSYLIYPVVKTAIGYTDQNPYNLLYQVLFLANFDSIRIHQQDLVGVAPMMVGINWSVSIEEQFYLIWPILFLVCRGRKFIIAILITMATSCVFRTLNTDDGAVIYYHTLAVMSDLALGAGFAYLAFYRQAAVIGFFRQIPRAGILVVYGAGIAFLMYNDITYSSKFLATHSRILNTLFFVFIILEQSYAANSFFKFSASKRISSFGKYTYGLYMLHPIGIQAAIVLFRYAGLQRETNFGLAMLYVLVSFLVAFPLAIASHHLLEARFLRLRKNFY